MKSLGGVADGEGEEGVGDGEPEGVDAEGVRKRGASTAETEEMDRVPRKNRSPKQRVSVHM